MFGNGGFPAELWATWIALSTADGPAQVYCDNQAVASNFHWLLRKGTIQPNWQRQDWWRAILHVLIDRGHRRPCPFSITWIPAHCFEELEPWQISPAQAHAAGTTIEHVIRNRRADRVAKECAARIAPIYPEIGANLLHAAKQHQGWLVRIHGMLDTTDCIHPSHQAAALTAETRLTLADAQTTFPQWPWHSHIRQFKWKPKIPLLLPPPKRWRHSLDDWRTICQWAQQLRWRQDDSLSVAFSELALAFHTAGFRLHGDYSEVTIHEVACKIRQAFQFLLKDDSSQPCPGMFHATFVKSLGRTLSPSAIVKAAPFLDHGTLLNLAQTLHVGAGRTIGSWRISFSERSARRVFALFHFVCILFLYLYCVSIDFCATERILF